MFENHECGRSHALKKHTEFTLRTCPVNVIKQIPLLISHNFAERSLDPETTRFPSDENALVSTGPPWPFRVARHFASSACQSLSVRSPEPVKIDSPVTEKHEVEMYEL